MLGIRQFADSLGCSQLVSEAENFIHSNFTKVSLSDEFINLSKYFKSPMRVNKITFLLRSSHWSVG